MGTEVPELTHHEPLSRVVTGAQAQEIDHATVDVISISDRDALWTELPEPIKQRIEFSDRDVRATVRDPCGREAVFKSIDKGPQAARVYCTDAVRPRKSRIRSSRGELHCISASSHRHAITRIDSIVASDGDEIVKLHGQPYPGACIADEAR